MADRREQGRPDERGMSEVLGFALVFALVVSVVLLVSVVGFDELEDTRDREELNNAERAFDVLADNMGDIHAEGAPSRATEINLQSAQLQTGDTVSIDIAVVENGNKTMSASYSVDPIVFSIDETNIVYSAGAVLRESRDEGLMISDPPIVIDENRIIMSVIQLQNDGDIVSTNGGTVRVRAENVDRRPISSLVESPSSKQKMMLNITSPRSELWEDYLESQGTSDDFVKCDSSVGSDKISCTIGSEDFPDHIYVSTTLINYAIEP